MLCNYIKCNTVYFNVVLLFCSFMVITVKILCIVLSGVTGYPLIPMCTTNPISEYYVLYFKSTFIASRYTTDNDCIKGEEDEKIPEFDTANFRVLIFFSSTVHIFRFIGYSTVPMCTEDPIYKPRRCIYHWSVCHHTTRAKVSGLKGLSTKFQVACLIHILCFIKD